VLLEPLPNSWRPAYMVAFGTGCPSGTTTALTVPTEPTEPTGPMVPTVPMATWKSRLAAQYITTSGPFLS